MNLSVIVPCKNEAGVVDHLLASLAAQTVPPQEIVVVDSHSTDRTVAHVKRFSKQLPLTITKAATRGVSAARNHGGQTARGDALLFIDADTTLPPDFIERFTKQAVARHLAVGGFTQRMPSRSFGIRTGARLMNGYARVMQHTPWPIAYSAIFTGRDAFDELGGFDGSLFIMEDYDYVYRAKKAGYRTGTITVPFTASDRRFVGPDATPVWQGIYAELYRYTHGLRITKPLFRYDMGGTADKKKK